MPKNGEGEFRISKDQLQIALKEAASLLGSYGARIFEYRSATDDNRVISPVCLFLLQEGTIKGEESGEKVNRKEKNR